MSAAVSVGLLLGLVGWVIVPPTFSRHAQSIAQPLCVIEQVSFTNDGLRLVGWIMKPPGDGPFPVVVWNHGSRITFEDGRMIDRTQQPTITAGSPCHPFVVEKGWMLFYPEGRGYYLSQGPRPTEWLSSPSGVIRFLYGRAADANAGREWLSTRPEANSACVAIGGASHGGITSVLASGTASTPYVATIAQTPGASYRSLLGLTEMVREGAKIPGPILIQHAANDTLLPVAISRALVSDLRARGRAVEYKEYPGLPGVEGHSLFRTLYFSTWGPDAVAVLERAFAGCPK